MRVGKCEKDLLCFFKGRMIEGAFGDLRQTPMKEILRNIDEYLARDFGGQNRLKMAKILSEAMYQAMDEIKGVNLNPRRFLRHNECLQHPNLTDKEIRVFGTFLSPLATPDGGRLRVNSFLRTSTHVVLSTIVFRTDPGTGGRASDYKAFALTPEEAVFVMEQEEVYEDFPHLIRLILNASHDKQIRAGVMIATYLRFKDALSVLEFSTDAYHKDLWARLCEQVREQPFALIELEHENEHPANVTRSRNKDGVESYLPWVEAPDIIEGEDEPYF